MPGERLYLDTSGPYKISFGGSNYWFMAVDDATRYKYTGFGKHKSDIGEFAISVFNKVKSANHTVKFVRCDNAGENVNQLQDACEGITGITMEYTAPYTPEQNGVVERAFASVRNRGYALMIDARLTKAAKGNCGVKSWMQRQAWPI